MKYLRCQDIGLKGCRCIVKGDSVEKLTNSALKHLKKDHPQLLKDRNYKQIIKLKGKMYDNIY